MIKYYVNKNTQTIHMVGDFPSPRGNGATNCGQLVNNLVRCTPPMALLAPFRWCLKCRQLMGLE